MTSDAKIPFYPEAVLNWSVPENATGAGPPEFRVTPVKGLDCYIATARNRKGISLCSGNAKMVEALLQCWLADEARERAERPTST